MHKQFLFLLLVFIESASVIAAPGPATSFPRWESPARLHRGRKRIPGTFSLTAERAEFRAPTGPSLDWPFVEIQTFDLLTPYRLTIQDYQNRGWRSSGERRYRFDLGEAMPPAVAAALAERVGKAARNGVPFPQASALATLPARHRTRTGGSNGTLRFREDGLDFVTGTGQDERAWRWADIETLANPDPFHLRVVGYRETYDLELKQPLARNLFDNLWDHVYARGLNVSSTSERRQP